MNGLLLTVFCSITLLANCQDGIKQYVQQHTLRIQSIEPAAEQNLDFEEIGKAIGDARVVMLGEQDHGDAPTFLAKTKLIKFLHEQKGFNVLVFENDFFSTNYNWQRVRAGELNMDSFFARTISITWTGCHTCQPLFKSYLPTMLRSGKPLDVAGIDNQMNTRLLFSLLDSVLNANNLPITRTPDYATALYPLLREWYKYTRDTAISKKIIDNLKTIKKQLQAETEPENFWVMTIENLIQEVVQFGYVNSDFWKERNTRDRQMALNLRWLIDVKYPHEKIIVWAHNYHVSKHSGFYPVAFINHAVTMGSVFTQDTNVLNKTYIIGFTSYEGRTGRLFRPAYTVDKPEANGFENWIDPSFDFGFVDFTRFNKQNPAGTKPFYLKGATQGNDRYHANELGEWNRIFDGVFFIRKMYPCVLTSSSPQKD